MSDQRDGGISWTDETWNPVRGCSRVSEGCRNCYAETMAARFSGPGQPYEGLARRTASGEARWTGEVRLVPEKLADPLRWRKARRVFVNSMSDLFHEGLSFEDIAAVFGVMAAAPQHTFQVLTKRPDRMLEWFRWVEHEVARGLITELGPLALVASIAADFIGEGFMIGLLHRTRWPLPNVHLGVSIEDQATADERIPLLLQCPAAVRWVSAEPLLGPVTLPRWVRLPAEVRGDWPVGHDVVASTGTHRAVVHAGGAFSVETPRGRLGVKPSEFEDLGVGLDWVVIGGESGPGARPFDLSWARSLIGQCKAAGVAVFMKQLGKRPRIGEPSTGVDNLGSKYLSSWHLVMKDRAGGDPAEWPEDLRVREFPAGLGGGG